jgi:hypothetical protein
MGGGVGRGGLRGDAVRCNSDDVQCQLRQRMEQWSSLRGGAYQSCAVIELVAGSQLVVTGR